MLLMCIHSGCESNDTATVCTLKNTVFTPLDAKSKFIFKDSSYWIYEDSSSGIIDSVWVSRCQVGIGNIEKVNYETKGKCYEGITVDYNSKRNRTYSIKIFAGGTKINTNYDFEPFSVSFVDFISKEISDQILMNGNTFVEESDPDYGDVVLLDSMKVKDQIFKKVICTSNRNSIEPYLYLEAYFASGIGLIKFKLKNGTTWNLIRHKALNY